MPEPSVFVWARNVGALLGLLAFAGTVVGWIANASFQRGFLVVFPWAGVACLVAAVVFSAFVAVAWTRLYLLLGKGSVFTVGDRPIKRGFKDISYFLAWGIFQTKTGRVVAGLGMAGIAGLLVLDTARKVRPRPEEPAGA